MSERDDELEASLLLRRSNGYLAHVAGLVVAVLAFGLGLALDDARFLIGSGAGLIFAGVAAIAAKESVVKFRGYRLVESGLEDEGRRRLQRANGVLIGVLLVAIGIGLLVGASWLWPRG